MASKQLTPLAARLAELKLNITAEECAAICRRPIAEVETWIAGDAEPAEALLRWLRDPEDAARRVDQLRRTYTRSLKSAAAKRIDADIPYGRGFTGSTGQVPR